MFQNCTETHNCWSLNMINCHEKQQLFSFEWTVYRRQNKYGSQCKVEQSTLIKHISWLNGILLWHLLDLHHIFFATCDSFLDLQHVWSYQADKQTALALNQGSSTSFVQGAIFFSRHWGPDALLQLIKLKSYPKLNTIPFCCVNHLFKSTSTS